MGGLYDDALVERLRSGAAGLAAEWGLSPSTQVTLLNISENATFRADDPERDAPIILRVHRPGYHTRQEIDSELAWLDSLSAEKIVTIARALPTRFGGKIAEFSTDGDVRQVVAFEFLNGAEPAADENLASGFRDLGAITARLHQHARNWIKPDWFVRKIWNFDATVGAGAHWGDWRAAMGLTPDGQALLERVAAELEQRLTVYGQGADRFGLIHADLRLANLLVEDGAIAVIDFDDCGTGWFAFDFAAAISFIETDPMIPDLMRAWIDGYRTVAPLSEEAEAMLPTFVMLRRLQLTAWLASHAETPTAAELGSGFTDGTLEIAEAFMADAFLSQAEAAPGAEPPAQKSEQKSWVARLLARGA